MTCPYAGKVPFPSALVETRKSMSAITISKKNGEIIIVKKSNSHVPSVNCTQVLLKVFAVGLSQFDALLVHNLDEADELIPGSDVVGYIQDVGKGVSKFSVGQPVYTAMPPGFHGGCAEFMCVDQDFVFLLNSSLNLSQGAAIGLPYFTACKALMECWTLHPEQTVLVIGANTNIGIASCQLASASHCTVIGSANNKKGLQLALENGATVVISTNDHQFHSKIQSFTNEKDVDIIIFTSVAQEIDIDNYVDLLVEGGTIMSFYCGDTMMKETQKTFKKNIQLKNINVMGFKKDEMFKMASHINTAIEKKEVRPVIEEEIALNELDIDTFEKIYEQSDSLNAQIIISLN